LTVLTGAGYSPPLPAARILAIGTSPSMIADHPSDGGQRIAPARPSTILINRSLTNRSEHFRTHHIRASTRPASRRGTNFSDLSRLQAPDLYRDNFVCSHAAA
jgi:hypothetical protein